jgi:tripartite-type tricarboxylate transporter receptor subunit TctC
MKKIFVAMVLAILSTATLARENITLAYSWSAADNAANFYRKLADEANKIQNQYTFVFEAKPGAGGTVAANYTNNNPSNTLWLSSSAAFIRPNLFPAESHDMANFRSIMPMCSIPFVIVSSKYKTWKEVPRDAKVSIGTSGPGATTDLVSRQVAKNYPNMIIVPFKSTSDATINVLGGSVDFAVSFHSDTEQYTGPNSPKRLYWLGQTGREGIKGTELLHNQGFVKELMDMSPPHQIFASRKLSEDRFRQLRAILVEASRAASVRNATLAENCTPRNQLPDAQLDDWHNAQIVQWRRLTQGIQIGN